MAVLLLVANKLYYCPQNISGSFPPLWPQTSACALSQYRKSPKGDTIGDVGNLRVIPCPFPFLRFFNLQTAIEDDYHSSPLRQNNPLRTLLNSCVYPLSPYHFLLESFSSLFQSGTKICRLYPHKSPFIINHGKSAPIQDNIRTTIFISSSWSN